jgi:Uma2 family endonuclease
MGEEHWAEVDSMSTEITDVSPAITTEPETIPPSVRATFEEYLRMEEPTMSEWIDGEVIFMAPASAKHQQLGSFLEKILGLFVEVHGLGEVFRAPYPMRIELPRRGREPDVFFVSREHAYRVTPTYLDGAADLAIEIISPDSVVRDREEKFGEYEGAGVEEYWLIDPEKMTAEFFELGEDRHYQLANCDQGIYYSKVMPGFALQLSWLWQHPLPTIDALRALHLM